MDRVLYKDFYAFYVIISSVYRKTIKSTILLYNKDRGAKRGVDTETPFPSIRSRRGIAPYPLQAIA